MKIYNHSLRKSGAGELYVITFFAFIFCFFGLQINYYCTTPKNEKKAEIIVSNYCNNIKKAGYLKASDKAKLTYDLERLGFQKVEIVAPDKKINDKTVSFTVTIEKRKLFGSILMQKSYLKKIELNNNSGVSR